MYSHKERTRAVELLIQEYNRWRAEWIYTSISMTACVRQPGIFQGL